jgi:arginase
VPEQRTRIHGRPVARSTPPRTSRIEATGRRRLSGRLQAGGSAARQRPLDGLGALDGGVVVAPRYSAVWQPGDRVRNERAIERYSSKLADRIERLLDDGFFRSSLAATAVY